MNHSGLRQSIFALLLGASALIDARADDLCAGSLRSEEHEDARHSSTDNFDMTPKRIIFIKASVGAPMPENQFSIRVESWHDRELTVIFANRTKEPMTAYGRFSLQKCKEGKYAVIYEGALPKDKFPLKINPGENEEIILIVPKAESIELSKYMLSIGDDLAAEFEIGEEWTE